MNQLTFVDADGREWTVEGYEDDALQGPAETERSREEIYGEAHTGAEGGGQCEAEGVVRGPDARAARDT